MLRRSSLRRRGGADRRMPKSGSSEPEEQPAQRPLRSGACRKAEAVSPKANSLSGNLRSGSPKASPPRATPKRRMPKSGSCEPEGQLAKRKNQPAEGNFRSGACRKAEAVNPKANHRAEARLEAANPSGENHPRRAFAIRRSKPRNEGSAEQCRHTYQYNRKTRL